CDNIPDIAPIIALTCATIPGVSTLKGVARLRIKECDRLEATCHLLGQMGVSTQVMDGGDTLTVHGGNSIHGGFEADVSADHRMAMLLAVAGSIADAPITVHGVESLNKSWPGFLASYDGLKALSWRVSID
ncbi:MAG: 3-phosphoshikimate 1-carboxyvinyltransferase, partial [Clostridia bacterium]|nr:3-phosphoshikimate 1-carboxyvinyltransferase [Clostridia bacterium]